SSTDVHVWRQELALQTNGVQSVRLPASSLSVWSSTQAMDATTQVLSVLHTKLGAQSAEVVQSVLHAVVPSQAYAPHGMGVGKGLQLPLPSQVLTDWEPFAQVDAHCVLKSAKMHSGLAPSQKPQVGLSPWQGARFAGAAPVARAHVPRVEPAM